MPPGMEMCPACSGIDVEDERCTLCEGEQRVSVEAADMYRKTRREAADMYRKTGRGWLGVSGTDLERDLIIAWLTREAGKLDAKDAGTVLGLVRLIRSNAHRKTST